MSENRMPVAFGLIVELAEALDVKNLNKLPGCWEQKVDDLWSFALNGHPEPREHDGSPVPPYTARLEYNGWPAGFIDPSGGCIAAGGAANQETSCEALRAAIQRAKGGVAS